MYTQIKLKEMIELLSLNYGFVCEAATVSSDGKVSILGIFDSIGVRQFPAVHPRVVVVSNWKGDVGEYKVQLELKAPDGKELVSIPNMLAKIQQAGGKANMLADLNQIKFEKDGLYLFQFSVEGQSDVFEIPMGVNQITVQ